MKSRLGLANTAFSFWLATVTFASLASAAAPSPAVAPPVAHAETHAPAVTRPTPTTAKPAATAVKAPTVAIPVVARDWAKAPAIVEHTAPGEILAVSDLHGHYEEAFKLFTGNGVIRGKASDPDHVEWIGGNATLVVVGDSINKGPGSVHIVDMLRQLQKEAPKFGGKVIVTLGNHEADFLHDPLSERSLRDGAGGKMGFGHEIVLHGETPEAVATGTDAAGRGAWIRSLPFAAKVNDYFFVHSGNTAGMTQEKLSESIQKAMTKGGFGHDHIIGGSRESPLGADDWKATAADAAHNAEKLGVKHIVMGHIPDALGARGQIARTKDGALIKLDTGLGNDVGEARMLRVGLKGGVKQLDDDGERIKVKKHDID